MTDSQIIALFWERSEEAIWETDAVYGRKLYAISDIGTAIPMRKLPRVTESVNEK